MFDPNGNAIKDWADENAQIYKGETGFEENFVAMIGMMVDEGSSNSRYMDTLKPFGDKSERDKRNLYIRSLVADGTIPENVLEGFKVNRRFGGHWIDYEGLAQYANANLKMDIGKIATEKDLYESKMRNAALSSKYSSDIMERSNWAGVGGQLLGGFVAAPLDPIVAASMLISLPLVGAARLSRAMYTVSNAARVGALEVGVQLAIEPFIWSWKEEIGVEYTMDDVIFNSLAAFGFGATIGGAASFLGYHGAGKNILFKERARIFQTLKDAGLDEDTADTYATAIHEYNNTPDKTKPVEDFIEESEARQRTMMESDVDIDVEPTNDINEVSPSIPEKKTKSVTTKPRGGIRGADVENVAAAKQAFQDHVDRIGAQAVIDFKGRTLGRVGIDEIIDKYDVTKGMAEKIIDILEDELYAAKVAKLTESAESKQKKIDKFLADKKKGEMNVGKSKPLTTEELYDLRIKSVYKAAIRNSRIWSSIPLSIEKLMKDHSITKEMATEVWNNIEVSEKGFVTVVVKEESSTELLTKIVEEKKQSEKRRKTNKKSGKKKKVKKSPKDINVEKMAKDKEERRLAQDKEDYKNVKAQDLEDDLNAALADEAAQSATDNAYANVDEEYTMHMNGREYTNDEYMEHIADQHAEIEDITTCIIKSS